MKNIRFKISLRFAGFLAALVMLLLGTLSCRNNKPVTKYGPPPSTYESEPMTKYGVPVDHIDTPNTKYGVPVDRTEKNHS